MSSPIDLSDTGSIGRFKEFLRIRTITNEGPTTGAHREAIQWLSKLCETNGIAYEVLEFTPGWPIFLLTIPGTDPTLPGILLNSHFDVVPVFQDKWNYPPFEAIELPTGEIVARGAQDMKCVCIQYLEALIRLRAQGKQFKRNVYAAFDPDEELGGYLGEALFVHSERFKQLNIGFALDEGLANEGDDFIAFYGERAVWWLHLKAEGPTGHGSRFIENTANEKLIKTINRFMEFRTEQKKLLENEGIHSHSGCAHAEMQKRELGDVTTVNLTMLKAGVSVDGGKTFSINVIPMSSEAGFDIRISPTVDLVEFEEKLKTWLEPGITYSFFQKVTAHHVTSIDPEKNPYWKTFLETMKSMGHSIKPQIFPAATDGRFLREIGIPCIGFSPIDKSPVLLHCDDERIDKNVFLRGISVYERLIPELANMP